MTRRRDPETHVTRRERRRNAVTARMPVVVGGVTYRSDSAAAKGGEIPWPNVEDHPCD